VVEHQCVDEPHFGGEFLEGEQAFGQVAVAAEGEHELFEDD
jgi:hypothetical protein